MAASNIIPFEYQGQPVHFSTEGWINATEIAKRFGKEPSDWIAQRDSVRYLVALAEALGKSGYVQELHVISELDGKKAASRARLLRLAKKTGLVKSRAGANGGTWLHPKLAVSFARWLDVDFAVWCDLQINNLLRGEVSVQRRFDEACKALSVRRDLASEQGRGLAQWRQEKPPLEERVEYWRRELQLTLPLVDGEVV